MRASVFSEMMDFSSIIKHLNPDGRFCRAAMSWEFSSAIFVPMGKRSKEWMVTPWIPLAATPVTPVGAARTTITSDRGLPRPMARDTSLSDVSITTKDFPVPSLPSALRRKGRRRRLLLRLGFVVEDGIVHKRLLRPEAVFGTRRQLVQEQLSRCLFLQRCPAAASLQVRILADVAAPIGRRVDAPVVEERYLVCSWAHIRQLGGQLFPLVGNKLIFLPSGSSSSSISPPSGSSP